MTSAKAQRLSPKVAFALSLAAFLLMVLLTPNLTRGQGTDYAFWKLLLPRALMAGLAGATLGGSGVVLQSVLKNDLASPFTLGVASGATLGAAIVVRFDLTAPFPALPWFHPIVGFALTGALITTYAVYLVSRREEGLSETLLLAGVGISLLVGAVVTALFLIGDAPRYGILLSWTMGNLQQIGYGDFALALPAVILGALFLIPVARHLNVLSLDDESARGLGTDVGKVRQWALFATGIMTAGTVAAVGPIGFVGLIVPHAVRLMVGPDARLVLPCAALLGGAFLGFCDCASRIVIYPSELPVGVVTSLIGSPIFIAMLMRKRR